MAYKTVIIFGKNHTAEQIKSIRESAENDESVLLLGDGKTDIHDIDLSPIRDQVDTETLFTVLGHGNNLISQDQKKQPHIIDGRTTAQLFTKIRDMAGMPVTIVAFSCKIGSVVKNNEITAKGITALMVGGSKYPTSVLQGIDSLKDIIELKRQPSETPISNLQIFKYLIETNPETFYFFRNQETKEEKKEQLLAAAESFKFVRSGKFTLDEIEVILNIACTPNAKTEDGKEDKEINERRQILMEGIMRILKSSKTKTGQPKTSFSIQGMNRILLESGEIQGGLHPDLKKIFQSELNYKLKDVQEVKNYLSARANAVFKDVPSVSLNKNQADQDKKLLVDILFMAISRGTPEVVEAIIKYNPQLINEKDASGNTVLMNAIFKGRITAVIQLVNHGVNILDPTLQKMKYSLSDSKEKKQERKQLRELIEGAEKLDKMLNKKVGRAVRAAEIRAISAILENAGENKAAFDYIDIENKNRPILSRVLLHVKSDAGINELYEKLDLFMTKKNLSSLDYKKRTPLQIAINRAAKDQRFIKIAKSITQKMRAENLVIDDYQIPDKSWFNLEYKKNVREIEKILPADQKLKESDFAGMEIGEEKEPPDVKMHYGSSSKPPSKSPSGQIVKITGDGKSR